MRRSLLLDPFMQIVGKVTQGHRCHEYMSAFILLSFHNPTVIAGTRVKPIDNRGSTGSYKPAPVRRGEIGKIRPVRLFQEHSLTAAGLRKVLVVPLTTQFRPAFASLRVRIASRGRLLRDGYVMVEQIRAINRGRFGEGPIAIREPEECANLISAFEVHHRRGTVGDQYPMMATNTKRSSALCDLARRAVQARNGEAQMRRRQTLG